MMPWTALKTSVLFAEMSIHTVDGVFHELSVRATYCATVLDHYKLFECNGGWSVMHKIQSFLHGQMKHSIGKHGNTADGLRSYWGGNGAN